MIDVSIELFILIRNVSPLNHILISNFIIKCHKILIKLNFDNNRSWTKNLGCQATFAD